MKNYIRTLLLCVFVLVSLQSSAQWSSDPAINLQISTNAAGDIQPEIISDGSGGVFVIWMLYHNEVLSQHLDANGIKLWGSDGVKAFSDALVNTPREFSAIADGSGGVIVVWEHGDAGNADIRAQRIGSDGTVQWGADGILLTEHTRDSKKPKLVTDNQGGAIAVWHDRESVDDNFDIYAQHINPDGTIQWAMNGIAICDAAGIQKDPVLTEDGNNGAFIAWEDARIEGAVDVYAQHIDATGASQWTPNGIKINGPGTSNTRIWQVTTDNSGAIIFVWTNEPVGYYCNLHYQKLTAGGNLQWGDEGIQVGDGQGLIFFARMIRGICDNMILTWEAQQTTDTSTVYAQQLNSSGEPLWNPDGVQCASQTGSFLLQQYPAITSDGNGGAIISFSSLVAINDVDLYAQHIDITGTLLWGPSATILSTGSGNFSNIASDGSGGAVVAWFEARQLYTDIYAQNICSNAQLGSCVLSVDEHLHTEGNTIYPNPNSGTFTINTTSKLDKIIITDIVGKTIKEMIPNALTTEVEINSEAGIYFVRMVSGYGETVRKIVVN